MVNSWYSIHWIFPKLCFIFESVLYQGLNYLRIKMKRFTPKIISATGPVSQIG